MYKKARAAGCPAPLFRVLSLVLTPYIPARVRRYVHFVEPRIQGISEAKTADSLAPFRAVWKGTFLAAGGFDREKAIKAVETEHADVIVFGRHWLANPGEGLILNPEVRDCGALTYMLRECVTRHFSHRLDSLQADVPVRARFWVPWITCQGQLRLVFFGMLTLSCAIFAQICPVASSWTRRSTR